MKVISILSKSFFIIHLFVNISFAVESISLKSLPEDGNITIEIVQDGDRYLAFIDGLERIHRFNIVYKKESQHGKYSFKPVAHNRISIYKTLGTTLLDGSIREIFQLFTDEKKEPYRLVAHSEKNQNQKVSITEKFKEYEFSSESRDYSKNAFLKKCGLKPNVKSSQPSDVRNYLLGISELCERDGLYKKAISSFKKIKIIINAEALAKFSIEEDSLIISSSNELFNSANLVYNWLEANL